MKRKNLLIILLPFLLAGCSLLRVTRGSSDYTPSIPESALSDEISGPRSNAGVAHVFFFTGDDATQYESQSLQIGEKPTNPGTPTRPGYVFDGWYSDEECTKVFNFNKTYDGWDVSAYAKWVKVDYYLYGYVDNTEISDKETKELSDYHFVMPEGEHKTMGATAVLYNVHLLPYDDLTLLAVREDGESYNCAFLDAAFRTPGYYNVAYFADKRSLSLELLEADEWVVEFRTPHTEGELVATFEKDHIEGDKAIFIAHDLHVTVGLKVVIIFAYSGNYEKSKFSSNFEMVGFGEPQSDFVTWYQIADPLMEEGYYQVGIEFHVDAYYNVSLFLPADLTAFNELILTFSRV